MKKIALGIIIGVLLATAVPAAAEEINKQVTATVRADYSLEIDGEKVMLESPPLVYDGKAHLPLREAATLLGKEVNFVDGVIKLDTPIADPVAELARLRNNIEIMQDTVAKAEETLRNKSITEEQRKTMEESLRTYQQALEFYEGKVSDLISRYPELAEQASE